MNSGRTRTTTSTSSHRARTRRASIPFSRKLVLNQWILSLFNVADFEPLADLLRDAPEGLDENNVHHFHHALTVQLFNLSQLPTELLLEYDQNIVKHTLRINERRITRGEEPIVWKYFQYLTLLFTEIYLDHYFRDPEGLLDAINARIETFNEDVSAADQLASLTSSQEAWSQLNKIAYWSATGSGKTLLMHVNIMQYQYYLERHGRSNELNRVLLLTPNEGLSEQHLREFEASGIRAELFNKDSNLLFAGQTVEILDIHKLRDEMGDKTIAVDAFEGNNLVLVDEGHRGASGGDQGSWMRYRNALCEKGFSFEYSATFGQAVKNNKELTNTYARCTLFDYSYRYFHKDGYGKHYHILNLDVDTQDNHLELYLVAGLLAFFQQQRLFRDQESAFRPFNLEKPLWVFVGGSVTKTLSQREASDVIEILRFLARYVSDRAGSTARIRRVLHEGLITADEKNLFAERFTYLNILGLSPEQIFDETLAMLFNAPGGGAFYVENLKGVTGEIALRVGDNDPFGVINVGDDNKLCQMCADWPELNVTEREFSGSLFHQINDHGSTINLLIGSRKFTEGWNSWRVSSMGLMNVGQSEGAQIIQLFGRGVRLKGYGMSLKRSRELHLPEGVTAPKYMAFLETLSIFGIRADYMAQFRDFLEEEGMSRGETMIEIFLPVVKSAGVQRLKTVRLKKVINGVHTDFGVAFRRLGPIPTLSAPSPSQDKLTVYLQKNQVVINWYPKIQALKSRDVTGGDVEAAPHRGFLSRRHLAFLDMDRLYFELQRYKAERGWHNLNIPRSSLADLLLDQSWYRLYIPEQELAFDSFDKVRVWEELALALLKKYTQQYYLFRKKSWEEPHLEYQVLRDDDPNLLGVQEVPGDDNYYRVLVDKSQDELISKLESLRASIASKGFSDFDFRGIKAIWFNRHLFQPLIYMDGKPVDVAPAPMNKGEREFVEDLKTFYEAESSKPDGYFADKELFLLRNLSKGRGVGFFEAGNFHPDFIIWLLTPGRQQIVFVDPKSISRMSSMDLKIRFFEEIKAIERRLGYADTQLYSFIISNTQAHTMESFWQMDKEQMERHHILFQIEDKETYIGKLFDKLGESD